MRIRHDDAQFGFDLSKLQRALDARERIKLRQSRPLPEQAAPQAEIHRSNQRRPLPEQAAPQAVSQQPRPSRPLPESPSLPGAIPLPGALPAPEGIPVAEAAALPDTATTQLESAPQSTHPYKGRLINVMA